MLPATIAERYRSLLRQRDYVLSTLVSLGALVFASFFNYYTILFATERASNPVTDLVLSNIPVFEVDGFFVYGTFIIAGISIGIILMHPKRLPFALKTVALFWIVRSIFVMLTHLGPPESFYISDFSPAIDRAFFGADQFFSAHTGMPFLGALAFWKEPGLRNFFVLSSVYFAAIVLLGHVHYSIDVASAFFITYGIFHIAWWLFPKDRTLFYSEH